MPNADYWFAFVTIGIKVALDLSKDVNQRVTKVLVWNDRNSKDKCHEMADDAEYEVVTLDFLAYGGDGYDDLRNSPKKYKIRQGRSKLLSIFCCILAIKLL